ncbi:phage head closure protein [Halobacillus sp. A5]|uniref:phage head closure protein n=1 Tax=Halobacillus sp. A5 TaxID=2880263 RepID=UPI0020A6B7C7|nr:phage head closure protein [Halobacillus sp. A5]
MKTFDHELTLIHVSYEEDEIGNQKKVEEKRTILCNVNSISKSEFYDASVQGIKPEIEFIINKFEYENESKVEFEGVKYSVIRTYSINFEEIELTCERVVGNG